MITAPSRSSNQAAAICGLISKLDYGSILRDAVLGMHEGGPVPGSGSLRSAGGSRGANAPGAGSGLSPVAAVDSDD